MKLPVLFPPRSRKPSPLAVPRPGRAARASAARLQGSAAPSSGFGLTVTAVVGACTCADGLRRIVLSFRLEGPAVVIGSPRALVRPSASGERGGLRSPRGPRAPGPCGIRVWRKPARERPCAEVAPRTLVDPTGERTAVKCSGQAGEHSQL